MIKIHSMKLTARSFVAALGDTLEDWALCARDLVLIAGGKAQVTRDSEVLFTVYLSHSMAVALFNRTEVTR